MSEDVKELQDSYDSLLDANDRFIQVIKDLKQENKELKNLVSEIEEHIDYMKSLCDCDGHIREILQKYKESK